MLLPTDLVNRSARFDDGGDAEALRVVNIVCLLGLVLAVVASALESGENFDSGSCGMTIGAVVSLWVTDPSFGAGSEDTSLVGAALRLSNQGRTNVSPVH